MKEAWRYLGCSFAGAERPLRRIRKAQDMAEYDSAVRQLFASCPVREDAGYRSENMFVPGSVAAGDTVSFGFVLWIPAAAGAFTGLRLPTVGRTVAPCCAAGVR